MVERGVNYNEFTKMRIFWAMAWGRALFTAHDNYGGKRNNYVCIGEWQEVIAGISGVLDGISTDRLQEHFRMFMSINRAPGNVLGAIES